MKPVLKTMTLLPTPRQVTGRAGELRADDIHQMVACGLADGCLAVSRLREAVRDYAGCDWPVGTGDSAGTALLEISPDAGIPAQGYRLTLQPQSLSLVASDSAGLFYGVMTLVQLLREAGAVLPLGVIEDHPDFPVRGVMLDISRDKVPTMQTLFALVDRLAEWKINHLELYTEHTFAYSRHRDVWGDASPMTGAEIRLLDAYCRDRFVELVPNQNSFGHMERWLAKPAYRDLAEAPDGFLYPWGARRETPNSLNPADPRSLELLAELYAELLPNFTSRRFNVGCDETWDLGQGKCKALCEQRGKGRVYLDFLLRIHELVRKQGRTMHFWGDMIIQHPELVPELPRDVVVLEWGYEADHPFAAHSERFAASGLPFYICPGTSSWNSIAGRTDNALANLLSAAENGLRHGAAGYLITDWGDNGHWQPLSVSYAGFAAGAALAWNVAGNKDRNWARMLDVQVFQDAAGVMGGLALDLGNAYLKCGHQMANASVLFRLLNEVPDCPIPEAVTGETLSGTMGWLDGVMGRHSGTSMKCKDASLIADEFKNAARMLRHACERGIVLLQDRPMLPLSRGGEDRGEGVSRSRLAKDVGIILSEHRRLWLARNRPGGLPDSVKRLELRQKEYVT